MSVPPLKSQIDRIRQEIEECGESIVTCEKLNVLCPNTELPSGVWDAVARIAADEGWSFTFLPDRSVCFAKLHA